MPSASRWRALAQSFEIYAGLQSTRTRGACPSQLIVALIAPMPAKELPSKIAGAKSQRIVIKAAARWPWRSNVISRSFHTRRLGS